MTRTVDWPGDEHNSFGIGTIPRQKALRDYESDDPAARDDYLDVQGWSA